MGMTTARTASWAPAATGQVDVAGLGGQVCSLETHVVHHVRYVHPRGGKHFADVVPTIHRGRWRQIRRSVDRVDSVPELNGEVGQQLAFGHQVDADALESTPEMVSRAPQLGWLTNEHGPEVATMDGKGSGQFRVLERVVERDRGHEATERGAGNASPFRRNDQRAGLGGRLDLRDEVHCQSSVEPAELRDLTCTNAMRS